jgi:hypothetical protein
MRWLGLVLLAVQIVVLVWMFRAMYRNYGRYGRADPGNAGQVGAGILVLVVTAQQIVQVIKDPSRTGGWVALGIGIIGLLFIVVNAFVRMRRSPTHQ